MINFQIGTPYDWKTSAYLIRLGFWKKSNLIRWLCVRVSVCVSVRSPLGNFYENMYSHVYGDQLSPWRVANLIGPGMRFLLITYVNNHQRRVDSIPNSLAWKNHVHLAKTHTYIHIHGKTYRHGINFNCYGWRVPGGTGLGRTGPGTAHVCETSDRDLSYY